MSEWNTETAEWYASKYGEYATNRLAVEALTFREDSAVVDVGCGTGSALRHAAVRVPRGILIGVDPVPRMIEIARERTDAHPNRPAIEFRLGSAEALPVDTDSADLVLAFDSFDHWVDIGRGFSEIRRILRPDGQLVVVKDGGLPGGTKARRVFQEELERAGFQVIDERQIKEDNVAFAMWVCSITS